MKHSLAIQKPPSLVSSHAAQRKTSVPHLMYNNVEDRKVQESKNFMVNKIFLLTMMLHHRITLIAWLSKSNFGNFSAPSWQKY